MAAARRRNWGTAVLVMAVCGMVVAAGGVASPSGGADLVGRTVYLCFGQEATIVGTARGETIYGTPEADVIVGLAGGDTIIGYEGDDLICGGGGKDVITPGPGINRVKGGPGDDVIAGGPRRDVVRAGGGDDIVRGNGGPDRLFGQTGNDRLLGGEKNDYLDGGDGNDYLNGGLGDDVLDGGLGTDTCYGETKTACELPAPPAPITFGNGTWVVPTDVPAGRYRMISDGTSCYWARLSGFSGEFDDIITNDFGYDTQIVDISATDKGFESSNCNTWSNDLTPRRSPSANWVSDGHLLVGTEIAAGTWRNSGMGEYCYWERLSGFSGELDDLITNDFTDSLSVVTIAPTDVGFYADPDCGTWTKVG